MNKIFFSSADKSINLKNRRKAKNLISQIFNKEGVSFKNVRFIFCSDEYLLLINKKHLNHNYYTDVITFHFSEKRDSVSGEIYMSVDRIKENAKSFSVSYQNELLRVMIHGILHLCGYRDNTKKSKSQMTEKENFYLSLL